MAVFFRIFVIATLTFPPAGLSFGVPPTCGGVLRQHFASDMLHYGLSVGLVFGKDGIYPCFEGLIGVRHGVVEGFPECIPIGDPRRAYACPVVFVPDEMMDDVMIRTQIQFQGGPCDVELVR